MTTVVALARDGHVWMAADSLTSVYDRPIAGGARKIRRIKAGPVEILVGVAGAGGMASAVAAKLKVDDEPAPGEDPNLWAEAIAHAVTELAFDHHQVEDGRMDATLILAWRGRLWTLGNGVAIPHPDCIAALGSGEDPAIGAMDALLGGRPPLRPVDVVTCAAEIAIRRDKHSGGPVQVEHLPAVEA